MQRRFPFAIALGVLGATSALGQTTTSSNPLNNFIGGVNSAVNIINSASASAAAASSTTPSSSSSSPTSASSSSPSPTQAPANTSAAAAHHGGDNHRTLIIAVVCAVVGALLLGLLLGLCCCWLFRRRRRRDQKNRAVTPVTDDEVKSWKTGQVKNPGRTYIPSQYGRIPDMEEQPMMAPTVVPRGNTPNLEHHPAYRHENPFVPVPPSPRRTAPNSRSGLTDGTVPGQEPYVMPVADPEKQRLRCRSRSHSRSRLNGEDGLPTHKTADRPPTPFGLSGIGQPYDDMHVHVLQHDPPSKELRQSLNSREPLSSAQRGPTPGYSTPPEVPSRSPRRNSQYTDSPYNTSSETGSFTGSGSDDYRPSYAPATSIPQTQPYLNHPRTQTQFVTQPQHLSNLPNRYSNSPTTIQPPPAPWAQDATAQRRQSPTRASAEWAESGRRASRSPATSINGQPRRLRFSDLQATPTSTTHGGWEEKYGPAGVGEAL